ncbi:MAG: ATP-dependent helicase, partial [Cyanobacteria bacterium MAG CAR4_bin_6]|nr:ATP-dependent helicase [Cyanobacteria bacterium MAG CAR4_bin_6]
VGLDDQQELKRKEPIPVGEAADLLAQDSDQDPGLCRQRLEEFLTMVSLPETERGGTGDGAFLAFKLHRFISGAGDVYTTLTESPRRVLFDGQLEDPETPGHRLYPTRFCRACGHEAHVVTRATRSGEEIFLPRNIDDTPIKDQDQDNVAGYLAPTRQPGDTDYQFTGELDTFPEDWREERNGSERLRANRKNQVPEQLTIGPDGRCGRLGASFWFIPGRFRFCPCCLDQPTMRERRKLTGLSGEGRSSATTLLVSTALEWMNGEASGIAPEKRKLLGFTDNRQDAALQAGHFNDFLFVSLLRGATLRAVLDAGNDGISEDEFGLGLVKALGFTAANKAARIHWMLEPDAGAVVRENAQRSLAKVLAHRVWTDLRRGWRYTNPSLAVLKLVDFQFVGLEDMARWGKPGRRPAPRDGG